jgi:hypothetical protein
MQPKVIKIPVGTLNSISSLHRAISKGLRQYSLEYQSGIDCNIEWDFRELEPFTINMSALTSFLSICKRLRKFSSYKQATIFDWNPHVFTFLNDVHFFQLARNNQLMTFSEEIVNGFETNIMNPNSRIIMLEYEVPPVKGEDLNEWRQWKDEKRHAFKSDIITRCYNLFDKYNEDSDFKIIKDVIAKTSAELALNSIMWGSDDAFVGLQRSGKGITVCVADCGIGFKQSLQKKKHKKDISDIHDSLEALILGSLVNDEEFGLRRAIDEVTKYGGWVHMSSYEAEMMWGADFWEQIKEIEISQNNLHSVCKKIRLLIEELAPSVEYFEKRRRGFCKIWKKPIRGSRISFEIPFGRHL